VPALLSGRFRARSLDAAARRWRASRAEAQADLDVFGEGLEDLSGNGRLRAGAAALSLALARHEAEAQRWEDARALFPPALEWFFCLVLGALFWLAGTWGAGTASS